MGEVELLLRTDAQLPVMDVQREDRGLYTREMNKAQSVIGDFDW